MSPRADLGHVGEQDDDRLGPRRRPRRGRRAARPPCPRPSPAPRPSRRRARRAPRAAPRPPGGSTTTTASARLATRRLGDDAEHRPAVDRLEQLVAPAHPPRRARRRARSPPPAAAPSPAGRPARGCGRAGISLSSPPTPIAAISASPTGRPGRQPLEHPVGAVQRRRARAARQADHRPPAVLADEEQVAGIDRHPEADQPPAGGDQPARAGVGRVRGRRAAEDQHDVARPPPRSPPPPPPVSCGDGHRRQHRPAERLDPRPRPPRRPWRAGSPSARASGSGSATRCRGRKRWSASTGAPAAAAGRRRDPRAGDGVGDDLDRRHHLPRPHPRPVGERGEGDRRVDRGSAPPTARGVDPEHARRPRRRR